MVRFFVEQIAVLEIALVMGLAVTIMGMTAGLIVWLKTRKSSSQGTKGSRL
jgi:hypothetical protein